MNAITRSPLARWFSPETLVQSLGIGLALTIVSRFAGLWRGVLFARLLDRAELGVWAITNSTMQMLSVVVVLGIPAGLCRYAARYERTNQLRPFLTWTLGVSTSLCFVACAAGIICHRRLAWLIYEDTHLSSMAVLMCLGALVLMVLNLFQGVLQGLRVYRINAIMLVAQSLGFALLGGFLLKWWEPTAVAGTWAFLLVSVVVTAIPCWMLWKHLQAGAVTSSEPLPRGMWCQLGTYSLGTWGASAVFALWGWLDRYILLHFDTLSPTACLEQLGTYHIVENVTGPLLALGAGWSTQVLAHTVHLWESDRREESGKLVQFATKLTMLVLVAGSVAMSLIKQWLLAGVFGDVSLASADILELILASTCLLTAQCMVRCYLLCQERVWSASLVWVGAVALSVGLNLVFVPSLHLKGAAMTAAVTSLASTWMLMWMTHRSGLCLDRGTWAVTFLPLMLLLPVWSMVLTFAIASFVTARTDWLFSAVERAKLDESLNQLLGRSVSFLRQVFV